MDVYFWVKLALTSLIIDCNEINIYDACTNFHHAEIYL